MGEFPSAVAFPQLHGACSRGVDINNMHAIQVVRLVSSLR
jgi:hypothetical protein